MTTVYRVAADDTPATDEPSTLVYRPWRRGHGSSAVGFFTLISPVFAGVAFALLGLRELALPVMVVIGVALVVARRRARKRPAATLRIEGRTLRAVGPSGGELLVVSLDELLDVTLDTKTIEIVQEAPGPVPELMYVNSTVGPALDTSRIQLVTRQSGVVPLTDEHMPHSDSLEWRGKMRQFLRKHGWKPEEPTPLAPAAHRKRRRVVVDAGATRVTSRGSSS